MSKAVEILVIMDRSGSMESIRDEAIGGFNTFLEEQKAVEGKANLTLVLFDDKYEVLNDSVDIHEVAQLTRETFVPRGFTAMNDAIGKALVSLEEKAPEKAIICIITDGEENASKEYTYAIIKDKIQAVEAKGWQVVFLAANIDVKAVGGLLGIDDDRSISFAANAEGMRGAYATVSASSANYRNQQ